MTKTLSKQIFLLYILQVVNQALGFFTVPYLARVLGPETYGQVAFAQGLVAYLLLLVTYGFDLSASRKVAHLENTQQLVAHIGGVVRARCLLTAIGLGLLFLLRFITPVGEAWFLLLPLYGLVLAQALSLNWLFWGRGFVALPLLLETGQRVSTVFGLLIWVRGPADGHTYALIAGMKCCPKFGPPQERGQGV